MAEKPKTVALRDLTRTLSKVLHEVVEDEKPRLVTCQGFPLVWIMPFKSQTGGGR
jgi:hypothetical protein